MRIQNLGCAYAQTELKILNIGIFNSYPYKTRSFEGIQKFRKNFCLLNFQGSLQEVQDGENREGNR